jgi:hypothetical protein
VIPVLVDGASMPSAEQLPEPLQNLSRRQAVRRTHERFSGDADSLVIALEGVVASKGVFLVGQFRKPNSISRPFRQHRRCNAPAAAGWQKAFGKSATLESICIRCGNGPRSTKPSNHSSRIQPQRGDSSANGNDSSSTGTVASAPAPAMTRHSARSGAGVEEAPRHEVAGSGAPFGQRHSMGI